MSQGFPVRLPQVPRWNWKSPPFVPWWLMMVHEWQAEYNHKQTLDELALRGGLSPAELRCVLENRPPRYVGEFCLENEIEADEWLAALLLSHRSN